MLTDEFQENTNWEGNALTVVVTNVVASVADLWAGKISDGPGGCAVHPTPTAQLKSHATPRAQLVGKGTLCEAAAAGHRSCLSELGGLLASKEAKSINIQFMIHGFLVVVVMMTMNMV